jgi:hypothetical protein
VAGSCERGDKPSGSGPSELVTGCAYHSLKAVITPIREI